MIKKIAYFNLTCDDCKIAEKNFKTHQKARDNNWAISRDRKNCYCPKCAPWHRYGIDYWEKMKQIRSTQV